MGSDHTFSKALYKAFEGTGIRLPNNGSVLLTIEDKDKEKILPLADRFAKIGYRLFATAGTAEFLREQGLHVTQVAKIGEIASKDLPILDVIKNGQVDVTINTMGHDLTASSDGFVIRETAIMHNVPVLTSLDTVAALLTSLENRSFATEAL